MFKLEPGDYPWILLNFFHVFFHPCITIIPGFHSVMLCSYTFIINTGFSVLIQYCISLPPILFIFDDSPITGTLVTAFDSIG